VRSDKALLDRNPTVVLTLENLFENVSIDAWAKEAIGAIVYTGWPFLVESKVISISDQLFRYEVQVSRGRRDVVKTPHSDASRGKFERSAAKIEEHYDRRYATVIGPVEVVVEVLPVKGMKRFSDGSLKKDFVPPRESIDVALQTVVTSVEYADPRFVEHAPLPVPVDFPTSSRIFFMGKVNYGCAGEVTGHNQDNMTIRLLVPRTPEESDAHLGRRIVDKAGAEEKYLPARVVCKLVGLSGLILSKVTSSLHVISRHSDQRFNLGLNLKFESKGRKVLGYTRKTAEQGWEYSTKAVELIRAYKVSL
jgi:5'-3' exoribonuclease 1